MGPPLSVRVETSYRASRIRSICPRPCRAGLLPRWGCASGARYQAGDVSHITGVLEGTHGVDDRDRVRRAKDGGRVAPEFLARLRPGEGIERRALVRLGLEGVRVGAALDEDLDRPHTWRLVSRPFRERHQLDAVRETPHERIVQRLVVVGERIGEIARQGYRRREGQAVLSPEDVLGGARRMPLLHDARRAADHHSRDPPGIEWALALETLDRLDYRLLRHMRRIRLERWRLDHPLVSQSLDELLQPRRRRECVEVARAALEDGGGAADTVLRQERALEAELARAPEVQPLGVATAPRELEETGARGSRNAESVGEPLSVEAVELSYRCRGAERPLRARIVEPPYRFEPHRRARDARGDLEPHGEGRQESRTGRALPLGHRECRWQHGAAGVRARQWLALEGADEHAVGESRACHVRAPIVPDDGSLMRAAEVMHDGHDASRPRLPGSHEAGSERVEDGDLAVLHESVRQIGELRLRYEAGERARLVHAPGRPRWSTAIRSCSLGTVSSRSMRSRASSTSAESSSTPAVLRNFVSRSSAVSGLPQMPRGRSHRAWSSRPSRARTVTSTHISSKLAGMPASMPISTLPSMASISGAKRRESRKVSMPMCPSSSAAATVY